MDGFSLQAAESEDQRVAKSDAVAVTQNWGPELSERSDLVAEFLESLSAFSRSLLGAKDNMKNHLVLAETEYAAQLDSMRTAADYRTASKCNG